MAQTSKAFPYSSFISYYTNGLKISNDSTTPNTKLDVAIGSCLDSTGTFQLNLNSPVVINAATNGLNGLDTGSLAASTVYAVYLVADPVTQQPSGCMISTSLTSPLLPFGYSAFALIGYVVTDSSSHFLLGYWTAGNSNSRLFMYDTPQSAVAVAASAPTSYTGASLATLVPAVANLPVWIYALYTPASANNALSVAPYAVGSGGSGMIVTGQVNGQAITQNALVMSTLNSTAPSIKYKAGNASDTFTLYVQGYQFSL